jgi:hypothetical protein
MALRRVVLIAGVAGLAAYVLRGGPKLPPDTDAIIEGASRGDLSHVVAGATGFADSSGVRIWYENIPPTGAQRGVVRGLARPGRCWACSYSLAGL